MINGAHCIIYSRNPEADRAYLRDVLGLSGVDTGTGWMNFTLPPAEIAVHAAEQNDVHEIYLQCDSIDAFVARLADKGFGCGAIREYAWGRAVRLPLPGGGSIGVYEPAPPK